jgi:chemotaxis protein MotB
MQAFKTTILVASLAALTGCASWDKSPICPPSHGWLAWPDDRCSAPKEMADDPSKEMADRLAALQKENQRLTNELDAARKQNSALSSRASDLERQLASANSQNGVLAAELAAMGGVAAGATSSQHRVAELERQLAERDKELADLRRALSAEEQQLKEAQRGVIRALRPEIEKGDITVDLNNERLLINLASGYLYGSGQDELKPAGADALKRVGAVLKDYPEYKVAVEGHTDNVAIRGELKKKFPTNKELSEARAANAAKALTEGGLGAATITGYSDTKPVEPNTSAAGRAKNRRIEVRVTK